METKYHHSNNPISVRHPLLDLLVRVGMKFDEYKEKGGFHESWVAYELPNQVRLLVYGDSSWRYSCWLYHDIRDAALITNEHELNEFLVGTPLADVLRAHKLNLLHHLISS